MRLEIRLAERVGPTILNGLDIVEAVQHPPVTRVVVRTEAALSADRLQKLASRLGTEMTSVHCTVWGPRHWQSGA